MSELKSDDLLEGRQNIIDMTQDAIAHKISIMLGSEKGPAPMRQVILQADVDVQLLTLVRASIQEFKTPSIGS